MFSLGSVVVGKKADGIAQAQDSFASEVDAVIAEFNGDVRAAIAALLHDLDALATDAENTTSRGYVRGRILRFKLRESKNSNH
jgi:hypothetical protein